MTRTRFLQSFERKLKSIVMSSRDPDLYIFAVETWRVDAIAEAHWKIASALEEYNFYMLAKTILCFVEEYHPEISEAKDSIVQKQTIPTEDESIAVIKRWAVALGNFNRRYNVGLNKTDSLHLIRFYNVVLTKHDIRKSLEVAPGLKLVV